MFATKIPDTGSAATAPRFPFGRVNVNQNVAPSISMPPSTVDA